MKYKIDGIKKYICILLSIVNLLSAMMVFTACGDSASSISEETEGTTKNIEFQSSEEDHRFDGIDYQGREFNIYTSTNIASSSGNSNFLIEGNGGLGNGTVSDIAHERNVAVAEDLGVNLVYTQVNLNYDHVAADIRRLTMSGDHEYDLVINDIYAFAELIIEGHFYNVLDEECVFDFNREYWYKDYMEDMRLMDGYQYILAGDYFIDILRTAHILLMNKQVYENYFQSSPDEIYDVVLNYEWTYDKMITLIDVVYEDLNGDGQKNEGDLFGYVDTEYWGATIPLATSGTTNYISRDEDGIPTITIQEGDRANSLAEAIGKLLNHENTWKASGNALTTFTQNNALITADVALGTLENEELRQMEGDIAVLPYPMLWASDKKYTTAAHDTTEMGVILCSAKDLNFISTVVEVLNRESARILLPTYYNEHLKIKLVDDPKASAMIDIIHDNFDNSFILAYNYPLGGKILQSFWEAAENERAFSAVYVRSKTFVANKLKNRINDFTKNNVDK